MAAKPPALPHPEEDSDSSADSDFGGSLSPSSGDESSASDNEVQKATKTKSLKRRSIEDSGDEGIVKEGKRKRRKKAKDKHAADEGTEESAIGMRVRERKLGRAADHEKKQPLASSEGSTVDVDALWARLNTAPAKAPSSPPAQQNGAEAQEQVSHADRQYSKPPPLPGAPNNDQNQPAPSHPPHPSDEDTITIKRTYVFAGETITEEKTVPKSSAEARLYLESQITQQPNTTSSPLAAGAGPKKPLRRPKKRPSMFDPNPEGIVKGLVVAPTSSSGGGGSKGPKLNVVEKSKLDWASHVDREGLKEELDVAEKAKGGYLGRMEFLGRSEAKREEEMRSVKKR
ncbi:MAG: hypothetical protein Q9197_002659 [Variospora fuerteventurae]